MALKNAVNILNKKQLNSEHLLVKNKDYLENMHLNFVHKVFIILNLKKVR